MATVDNLGSDVLNWWQQRNDTEATRLLKILTSAQPRPDGFIPHYGMPGGADVPRPSGLYSPFLVGAAWPTESESGFEQAATDLEQLGSHSEQANEAARAHTTNVFTVAWTKGEGSEAAQTHYGTEEGINQKLVAIAHEGATQYRRLGKDIRTIKQKMRQANDEAHEKIAQQLRSNGGSAVGVVPILVHYQTMIGDYSLQLKGYVTDSTTALTNQFGNAPATKGPVVKPAGRDKANPDGDPPKPDDLPGGNQPGPFGPGTGPGSQAIPGQGGVPGVPQIPQPWTPSVAAPAHPSMPSLPSMPSMPSLPSFSPLSGLGGGGLGPLSGLFGKFGSGGGMGGLGGLGGNLGNSGAFNSPAMQAISSAFTSQIGSGLAAGATPAMAAAEQAVPKTPVGPLAAPVGGSAPLTAAPASAVHHTAPADAADPATPAAGAGMTPMTSYGAVLPPGPSAPTTPAGGAGGFGASIPPLPPPSAPLGGGGHGGAGFLPATLREPRSKRVSREVSMTDLELARTTVADLAAASCVVNPGLDWAVAIARGSSGLPEMWIATNEGAGYIPLGVYLPRSAPLAAGLDADFDARWFGWFNPAETVMRAIIARGDVVSAIASTWMTRTELIAETVADVALGVPPAGGPADAEASHLTRNRSHRLETLDPALFDALKRADAAVVDRYCRNVIEQVAFGHTELTASAQSVARALVSGRAPSTAEWQALRTEYEAARLVAGSQRPGLTGIEDAESVVRYMVDYAYCRRLEALLCWEAGTPADVVYAARMAGVVIPFTVLH